MAEATNPQTLSLFETYAWFLGLWCIVSWLCTEFDQNLFTSARAAESWTWRFFREGQPAIWLIGLEAVAHFVPDPLSRGWTWTTTFGVYAQLWFLSMIGWGIKRMLGKRHGVEVVFPGDTIPPKSNGNEA